MDAALSREQVMLRELFSDHFKLADRFETAAQQISVVERSLHGTKDHQGIAELLLDAAEQCRLGAEAVSRLNISGIALAVARIHDQLSGLPSQLLRPDQCEDFRKSVRDAMTDELDAAVQLARERAVEAGTGIAISELQALVVDELNKAEAKVFGSEGSRADLFYKLKEAKSALKSLTTLNEKLSKDLQRISGLHREEMNAREDKARGLLVEAHKSIRDWSIAWLLVGLLFGGLAGAEYLAPKLQEWLSSVSIMRSTDGYASNSENLHEQS